MQSIFTRKILVCAVLAAAALGSAAVSSAGGKPVSTVLSIRVSA